MDIFDLAKATGLSREHIRYYAERGIIADRSWKTRKEYFPEDVSRLKKAVLFRKLGFDVYEVTKILDESIPLEATLASQMELLKAEKEKFDGAYNLCTAILEELRASESTVKTEHLDADRWYEFVRREEAAGRTFIDCWQDFPGADLLEPFYIKDLRKNKRLNLKIWMMILLAFFAIEGILCWITPRDWKEDIVFFIGLLLLGLFESLPRYFLGKKHPWLAKWMSLLVIISLLLVCIIIVIVAGL